MDHHRLRVFRAVAASLSFTGAAEQLHLSQPVVSRHVRDLEHELGVPLLDRTTRSVSLTTYGAELLEIAEDLLDRHQAAIDRFAAYCRGESGSLVIAALPSVAAGLLPAVLAELTRAHPAIHVEIVDVTASEATRHVATGRADVAIAEATTEPGLDSRHLRRDRMVAVLPPGHPLAEKTSVSWSALSEQRFVTMSHGSSVRRLTDLAFAQANLAPAALVETRNIATAAGLVSAGLAVTAMPELVLPVLGFVPLVCRELHAPSVARDVVALTRAGARISPPARRFLALLPAGGPDGFTAHDQSRVL